MEKFVGMEGGGVKGEELSWLGIEDRDDEKRFVETAKD